MKRIVIFIVLLLIGFSTNSCDEAEKLLDVPFNVKVKEDIPVNIQGVGVQKLVNKVAGIPFDESVILSIDNEDTHDYLKKIKEVKVNSLTYKFTGYSGNTEGYIVAELYADDILLAAFEGDVQQASNAGTTFRIDNVDNLNKVANKLKNGYKVRARLVGEASAPMYFNLHIEMDVKVVANPL